MTRCVNIDWLEVHVLEDNSLYPCDVDFFIRHGWQVNRRDYGTRVYNEMFTLLDKEGQPFLEIRRNPKSDNSLQGILDPLSCHIRLVNRYCYFDNAVTVLRDFLAKYSYTFRRIYRIDICLDFEKFDLGDYPQKFVTRYLAHKYSKINQCNRTTHGTDKWAGCEDNYISWGNPKSMVSTKLYNKSKELREVHDKPYIRQSWWACGLVDNPMTCTKRDREGKEYKPEIWRVEFSVHAGSAGWCIIEDCNGAKRKLKSMEHRLDNYDTREKILQVFASLAHHYFHFKVFEPDQRKDRCKDKVLFVWKFDRDQVYKLERVAQQTPISQDNEILRRRLMKFAASHTMPEIGKAIQVLLKQIDDESLRKLTSNEYNNEEFLFLRTLLAERLNNTTENFDTTVQRVREIIDAIAHERTF